MMKTNLTGSALFSIVLNSYTQNNESVIMNSNFFLDEPIHDFDVVNELGFRKGINSFIKLFDVFRNPGGLIITENNFDILSGILQSPNDYGKGISSFNSTFQASSNTFNNLDFGLISGASNTLNTFSFKCNTLTNMIHGAHISGIDYFQMHTNNIQIAGEAHPYGIYMENCTGYMLEQNTLSYNSSNWNLNPAGLINYFATPNNNINEIRNNTFSNFKYGMVMEGENRSNFNYNDGLELWCNTLENYEYAMAVTHPPGIAGIQNGPASTKGANNLFESYGCNFSNEGELYNPAGNNPFRYVHKLNSSTDYVEPVSGCFTVTQVTLQQISQFFDLSIDCPTTIFDCSPVLLTVNPVTSNSNNTSILKIKTDSINAPLSELDINKKIRFYLHDSGISNPEDSIISLIQTTNSIGRNYLLAFAFEKSGSDSNRAVQLNSLNNDSIYAGLNSIATITDSVNWNELKSNNSEKADLTAIAMDSSKYAYTAARNILRNVYDELFPEVIILPSTATTQPRIARNKEDSEVKIYPNPFTSELIIDLTGLEDVYEVVLINILGVEMQRMTLAGNQNYKLSTTSLSSGLYFIHIICKDLRVYSELLNHVSH